MWSKKKRTISWSWYRIPTCVKKITLHVGMKNVEKCAGERINKSLIFILHFAQKRIEWGITKQKPTSFLCSSRWLMNYSLEEWNEFWIQLEKNIDWTQWCMADYTRPLTKQYERISTRISVPAYPHSSTLKNHWWPIFPTPYQEGCVRGKVIHHCVLFFLSLWASFSLRRSSLNSKYENEENCALLEETFI